jgi:hypothetical protein
MGPLPGSISPLPGLVTIQWWWECLLYLEEETLRCHWLGVAKIKLRLTIVNKLGLLMEGVGKVLGTE